MDKDNELELIDLGDAKEETRGNNTMWPQEENVAFPFGVRPPGRETKDLAR
jgi:hypothetical protein